MYIRGSRTNLIEEKAGRSNAKTFVVMAVSYRIIPPGVVSSPHLILYLLAAIFAQRQVGTAKRSQG